MVNFISVEQARELIQVHPDLMILDVRTDFEFAQGHLPLAHNVDINDDFFEQRIAEFDKNRTYIVHCKSGGRSAVACEVLEELGFKRVYNLKGNWKELMSG
ncbi:rhodanese-like domain-containing protein [Candidatus Woesearchaeota archaeon]|nr:rhodanese-like domain-containing protein [Candidatus Woesearchaeota archaeon]